ncbi:hypothetical protein [Pelagicoccus sp. SDUM812002]|uniref:hypothetical protein n=1 Tax=Pelagicoccus sp. SDUM812002 TaxID=3041266 RepID=UPI00280EE6BD|nr:hypothetical protein [Pelagicoccus sp. SDUM812002]MDQ8184005.1 hypothetical protein [Pelagicoccus sp. SDUM812002]
MNTPLEDILVSGYAHEMEAYLQSHPEDFPEAIDLAVAERERYSWRAAWLLGNCMEKNDKRVRSSLDRLIAAMPGKPDGHWRELMKIVAVMSLNDEQEGHVFDIAMQQWLNPDRQASVRWKAFQFITDTVHKYPELAEEVKLVLLPELIDPLSPGVRRSVSKEAKKNPAIHSSL